MEYVIYFILTFLLVYMISYFFIVRKAKKYDPNRIPVEVSYLLKKYKLNIKQINYRSFVNTISLVGSLIMAITVLVIFPIENILLQLIVAFIVMIPLIIIGYKLVGIYYQKKGSSKNEHKRNRK